MVAVAPRGGGQPFLAVGFEGSERLLARSCAAKPCVPAGGTAIVVPPEVRPQVPRATLRVARIGMGRTAVVVTVPSEGGVPSWEAVVAATPGAGTPKVVFSGATGFLEGVDGERSGPVVQVAGGRVHVGVQRENRSLCGRPVMLAPRVLHPKTLELAAVKLQRLGEEDRARAERLEATPATDEGAASRLTASWATSAAEGHPPAALADGDPKTSWAEGSSGTGRGEFVVLLAPKELPIKGFDLILRPEGDAPPAAIAPSELWLVTDDSVFNVRVPKTAGDRPGGRFSVALESPLQTSCVALVLESAEGGTDARVTVAELAVRTEFATAPISEMVAALHGGGPRAEAAGAALRAGGPPAFAAVAKAFGGLDEGGRRVALDVMDHASCALKVPVFVEALAGAFRGQRLAAQDRIRSCGSESADALVAALEKADASARSVIAEELAVAAPAAAVTAIVPRLRSAGVEQRRHYRVALAEASRSEAAADPIRRALADSSLDPVATIDLLRALGSRVTEHAETARAAFARLATPQASFRTRFLLIGVAEELAAVDATARTFFQAALSRDRSPHIRARAARVVRNADAFREPLLRALDDPAVRVREAAAFTLGESKAAYAAAGLMSRLAGDPWPLVRSTAARALGKLGPDPKVDATLVEALNDDSPHVRRPVLLALGARGTRSSGPAVMERLNDGEETHAVRGAAALALGMMCETRALDDLTSYARGLADPQNELRDVARGALTALALLHPADLSERLAPLRQRGVATVVRQAAEVALKGRGRCPKASA